MNYDQILPELYCGSCPRTPADVDALRRAAGVTAVLNLQTDEDFESWGIDWPRLTGHYQAGGVEVRRVPVRDFDLADLQRNLRRCVAALEELLRAGHTVYVHCNAGINRSPSTVIAYLHWAEDWALDEALIHVHACRDCDPYLEAILLAGEDEPGDAE